VGKGLALMTILAVNVILTTRVWSEIPAHRGLVSSTRIGVSEGIARAPSTLTVIERMVVAADPERQTLNGGTLMAQRKETDPRQSLVKEFDSLAKHPEKWDSIPPEKLKHFVFFQILQYGAASDERMIQELQRLYAVFVEKVSFEDRSEVLEEVFEALERGVGFLNALLPFIYEDPAAGIVTECVVVSAGSDCEDVSWFAAVPKSTLDVLGSSVVQLIVAVALAWATALSAVMTGPKLSAPYVAV